MGRPAAPTPDITDADLVGAWFSPLPAQIVARSLGLQPYQLEAKWKRLRDAGEVPPHRSTSAARRGGDFRREQARRLQQEGDARRMARPARAAPVAAEGEDDDDGVVHRFAGHDLLLERLRAVHGEPREDVAPVLMAARQVMGAIKRSPAK